MDVEKRAAPGRRPFRPASSTWSPIDFRKAQLVMANHAPNDHYVEHYWWMEQMYLPVVRWSNHKRSADQRIPGKPRCHHGVDDGLSPESSDTTSLSTVKVSNVLVRQ